MSDQKWSWPDTAAACGATGLESSNKVHKIHTILFKTFLGEPLLREAQYSYNDIQNILLSLYYHLLLDSKP